MPPRKEAVNWRDVWSVAIAQVPSSLSTFLPALILSFRLPATEFGKFSAVMLSCLVGLECSRAAIIQPLQVSSKAHLPLPSKGFAWAAAAAGVAAAISALFYSI